MRLFAVWAITLDNSKTWGSCSLPFLFFLGAALTNNGLLSVYAAWIAAVAWLRGRAGLSLGTDGVDDIKIGILTS